MESITVIVQYKIKKKKLAKAKEALSDYVDAVKKNEPGTIEYKVFQDNDDSSVFVHLMSFVDKNAKKAHEKTEHLKKLKKVLVPMSKGKDVYITLEEVKFIKTPQITKETKYDVMLSHEQI